MYSRAPEGIHTTALYNDVYEQHRKTTIRLRVQIPFPLERVVAGVIHRVY